MAKLKLDYICQSCGSLLTKWQGQCPSCLEWNTLIENRRSGLTLRHSKVGYSGSDIKVKKLKEVTLSDYLRIKTQFNEFDRVMGGGIVPGSVTMIGGDPGIGKSSILLQITTVLSMRYNVLYVTGEESLEQVALRAKRMQLSNDKLFLMSETNIEKICQYIEIHSPNLVVIDSIQTMNIEGIQGATGGITQIRESATLLTQTAKNLNCALFLIGHVTKTGELAGPRVLEHIVDTVLFIEGQSDRNYRIVRSLKNRFGAVNELGFFIMTAKGMCEVKNPSEIFLNRTENKVPGSVIAAIWEGSRPILAEIQALVVKNDYIQVKRLSLGLDPNRLSMLLAITQRYLGVKLSNYDVFINIAGGIKVNETSIDLSIIAVIISSFYNHVIDKDLIIFGEVGLSGEIRAVSHGQERLNEAQKHNFKKAIIPHHSLSKKSNDMKILPIKTLSELKNILI